MTKVFAKAIGILALSMGLASGAFAWTPSAHIGVQITSRAFPSSSGTSSSVTSAPEIDPAGALSGVTLLLGGLAMVRGRRAKK